MDILIFEKLKNKGSGGFNSFQIHDTNVNHCDFIFQHLYTVLFLHHIELTFILFFNLFSIAWYRLFKTVEITAAINFQCNKAKFKINIETIFKSNKPVCCFNWFQSYFWIFSSLHRKLKVIFEKYQKIHHWIDDNEYFNSFGKTDTKGPIITH